MNKLRPMHLAPLVLAVLAPVLLACTDPEHVPVAEFMTWYEQVDKPQSVKTVDYLGERDGRAYLRLRTKPLASGAWKERVIYVQLTELDPAFRATLPHGTARFANH